MVCNYAYVLQNEVPGCEYFIKMDPDFLLQIVELYLTYAPSEVRSEV